jgi:hypothetical protein
MHAQHDPVETTAKARAIFRASFEDRVDPEHKLDPAERKRRAEHRFRQHMASMAYRAARARHQKSVDAKNGGPNEAAAPGLPVTPDHDPTKDRDRG